MVNIWSGRDGGVLENKEIMRRSGASVQSDEEWCLCAIGEVRSSGVMKCGDVWRCLVKWDSDLK